MREACLFAMDDAAVTIYKWSLAFSVLAEKREEGRHEDILMYDKHCMALEWIHAACSICSILGALAAKHIPK